MRSAHLHLDCHLALPWPAVLLKLWWQLGWLCCRR